MKIIQPSRRFKKNSSSKSDPNYEVKHGELVYEGVSADLLARKDKERPKARRKTKRKPKSKQWKASSKRESDELEYKQNSEGKLEFDFDTSTLEAMPRDELIEEIPVGKKRRRSELSSEKACQPLELTVDLAKKEFNELFARGVRLLAMREHSVKELTNKLFDKSENSDTIHAVIDELLKKKYLSDQRFAESYIRARGNRGFGPVRIKAELKSKGVSNALIQDHLDEGTAVWFDNAESQYQKKYGDGPISDYREWTKRARFLQSRGFTMDHIQVAVPQFYRD